MSALEQYPPTLTADQWADRIRGHLRESAMHAIAAGFDLLVARDQVAHGEWMPMLERVGIADSTARKLMAIGRRAESFRGNDLPASVGALYELTRLDQPQLEAAVADGRVHAGMTRSDAVALRTFDGPIKAAEDAFAQISEHQAAIADYRSAVATALDEWRTVDAHRRYLSAEFGADVVDDASWAPHDEAMRSAAAFLDDTRNARVTMAAVSRVQQFRKQVAQVDGWLCQIECGAQRRHGDPWRMLPPMPLDQYISFRDDIAEQGVLVPVEYDEHGNVLDGFQRLRACWELGITEWPRVVRGGMDTEAKVDHVFVINMIRVHLTDDQRAFAIAKAEALANGGAA